MNANPALGGSSNRCISRLVCSIHTHLVYLTGVYVTGCVLNTDSPAVRNANVFFSIVLTFHWGGGGGGLCPVYFFG